jgi:hypothetical protein
MFMGMAVMVVLMGVGVVREIVDMAMVRVGMAVMVMSMVVAGAGGKPSDQEPDAHSGDESTG